MNISEVMTAEEQNRYINNLIERINATELENRAMDLVLQVFLDKQRKYEKRLSKLDEILSRVESLKTSIKDGRNKRKAAEGIAIDLKAKLKLARLNK